MTYHCTPRLRICDFDEVEWIQPDLKADVLEDYSKPLPPFREGPLTHARVAENTDLTAWRMGLDDRRANTADERNLVKVEAVDGTQSVLFNFPAWLIRYGDISDRDIPYSVIDGYPAHLCFFGGEGRDRAIGGTYEDELWGYGGSDFLFGGGGNDLINGGADGDVLRGQDGDDVILGEGGVDVIIGGAGDDQINGGDDNDRIFGDEAGAAPGVGDGDDCIEGGNGNDVINAGDGDNLIFGNNAGNTDRRGPDRDTINSGDGDDTIFGQDARDTIDAGDGDNQVDGGDGNDRITTGEGDDKVVGGEGNDRIWTNGGDDEICADEGNDRVWAGDGDDKVKAGDGDDRVWAGDGDDVVLGGDDDDILRGEDGDDVLAGQDGDDIVMGGDGNDTLFYGAGTDIGVGGSGDDTFKFDDERGRVEDLGRNLIQDFTQDFFDLDTIDFKCVSELTHMSVIALSDDRVRMIGYSDQSYREGGAWQDDKSHWYFGDDKQIFDVFVYGENVGTINSAAGSLMQDTAYSDASGPVCLNDVFVDIGNTGDWDKSWYVGGGEDYIG